MHQNPMMSSRVQVGGRQMPAWFSTSLANQSRVMNSTPPPLPHEPPPVVTEDESEYEEIDQLPRSNGPKRGGRRRPCSLCGNTNAVVLCEMCEFQIFCGPCNDMYHRHPKRLHHARKLIDPVDSRPPLPPKTFLPNNPPTHSEVPIVSSLPPIPPPRRNKRFPFGMGMRSATSSPTLVKKTFDPMGTLKRFVGGMGQRPLPAPPKPAPPLPPKPLDLSRPTTPVFRGQINAEGFDRRHSSPAPQAMQMGPFNNRRQIMQPIQQMSNARNQSISVANLSMQRPSSRNNGYPNWEEEDYFARQRERAHSISTPNRHPTTSQDASHFATLQRPKRGPNPPERPPPPLPPRSFPSQPQLAFQSSQSAFNINQMGMHPQFSGVPWNYSGQGYPSDFQQTGMMYPGSMRRTPSNQSMGGHPQQFFGWGPMGFGPPMTQQEMEMEILSRREVEPMWMGPPPRPSSVSQSQPVTPQGSFRRKSKPTMYREDQGNEMQVNERFNQNQQINRRSSTPRSLSRMNSSPIHFQETIQALEEEPLMVEGAQMPEGPWTCEHCTFINPKSSKICTVCCKTPSNGYRPTGNGNKPNTTAFRKGSTSSTNENEDIPVIQSKLSISREKQQATINLIESVERVKTPMDKRTKTVAKPSSMDEHDEEELDEEELQKQAKLHKMKINTKRPKGVTTRSSVKDSNEDVYGSVPIQTLTISPKIEIRRHPKTVSTGVSSSPTKSNQEQVERNKPTSSQKKKIDDKLSEKIVKTSNSSSANDDATSKMNKRNKSSSSKSSSTSSSSSKAESIRKSSLAKQGGTTSSSLSSKQTVSKGEEKIKKDNGESGNESNQSSSASGSSPTSELPSSVAASESNLKIERKSSKGTSPPPQNISTQTYEELPVSKMRQKSISKTSMTSTQSDDFLPPKPIEMSEKALRYARKAQHHHNQAKLKRSMSTHLTSASEPWADSVDAHGHHLYRSSSRHSLFSDTRSLSLSGQSSRDTSPPRGNRFNDEFRPFPTPSWDRLPTPDDYFASLEDLVSRRRKDSTRSQECELGRLLKEAEEYNYTPEDVQVALRMCGERNPVKWLQDNWSGMIETVQTLATKYGREKGENNQIGTVSSTEARDTLRKNRGNVWAAVTECIEKRRKKFMELQSRGTFLREDILTALTANHGNLDAAYVELSKAQLKPFLMRIWGPPTGLDNDSVPPPIPPPEKNFGSLPVENMNKDNSVVSKVVLKNVQTDPNQESEDVPVDKAQIGESLEHETRVEMLVSSAAKVSQEIEKAIQELKQTQPTTTPKPKLDENVDHTNEIETLVTEVSQVKSDEEENFVDAVSAATSDSDVNAVSPQNSEIITPMDDDFDDDEDVLEIAIDDTEANEISEFIQNYEVVTLKPVPSEQNLPLDQFATTFVENNPHAVTEPKEIENKSKPEENSPPKEQFSETVMPPPDTQETNSKSISSGEIEQLLSTLTTTFTEMGQFATDIKAQIASEIQQQLAAAVTVLTSQNNEPNSLSVEEKFESSDQVYESVDLPESISENVDKKIAKYKRLAAKHTQKSNRHKSPDARYSRLKEKSKSPSPGSSISEALPNSEGQVSGQTHESSSPFPNNAQIEIVGNSDEHVIETKDQDYMPRDEGEYDSGPDDGSSDSDSNVSEIQLDDSNHNSNSSLEEVTESSEGEMESSMGSDAEDRLVEGDYEEVDISRRSDPEIYTNKDTDKVIIPSAIEEDLPTTQNVKEQKTEKEMKAEKLVNERKVETVEKATLAIQLMEMNFPDDDSVHAANECSSLYSALSFLQQECDLCAAKFSARQMISMLSCQHSCCRNCAKDYFTVQIRDKTIVDATCPFCSEPTNLTDDTDIATEYFNHLDILLKSILEPQLHEMFQRKLRDWTLAKTPNFKWCSKCTSGFITEPLQHRLICPECNAVTCAICLEQWDKFNHDHRQSKVKVCDSSSKSIVDYLNENSIECPRCHFRFSLARGGCMHLTCTQCRHDFCSGCSASFRLGDKCDAKLPICEKLGLHAHHPRNCLFYLRDKEPEILAKLLEENAIPYLKENSEITSGDNSQTNNKRTCLVPIQKETTDGLRDDFCGKDAPEGYATVCKAHYVEYLGLLIWQNHLDPISILSSDDLEVIIRRANRKHPGRPGGKFTTSDEEFRNRLLKVIQEEIPL